MTTMGWRVDDLHHHHLPESIDIADGLAADFDGSLSGLGVELGASAYNMSEALLALPVFKQETLDANVPSSSPPSDSSLISSPAKSSQHFGPSTSHTLFQHDLADFSEIIFQPEHWPTSGKFPIKSFQYVLCAPTSPGSKVVEDTLTYLNQGQPYELKTKKISEHRDYHGKYYKTLVRILFHERRMQYMEREQIDTWRQTRPGERILDIDIPLSNGLVEVNMDPYHLNAIEYVWDPMVDTTVCLRIHCISTEFTAKKHGGEKGVPFRIQADTFTHADGDTKYLYSAASQIKVFKPKGADRKNKTDRERIEKLTSAEKKNYLPSYDCTVLTEVPVEQLYSSPVASQPINTKAPPPPPFNANSPAPPSPHLEERRHSIHSLTGAPSPSSSPISTSPFQIDNRVLQPPVNEALSPDASANRVADWLIQNRFGNYVKIFQNFCGADLLRLTRDDLIQICGLADGIRLNNSLQYKVVRPRLTMYICEEGDEIYHAIYMDTLELNELLLKVSQLFNIGVDKVVDIYFKGPSGIHVLMTSEVLQNFEDQARFSVEPVCNNDQYRFIIKLIS